MKSSLLTLKLLPNLCGLFELIVEMLIVDMHIYINKALPGDNRSSSKFAVANITTAGPIFTQKESAPPGELHL